ncbi:MAG TPA: acetylxylan esterase [Bryobacteraceae bacterium]|nr:acetylxylan esterase [Bryobacteraceae bacterium]
MRTLAWMLLFSAVALPQTEDAQSRLTAWMDRLAQQALDRRAAQVAAVRTVEEAERRKQLVRDKILELLGGLPDYTGPLNARVTGKIERPSYVIEKVIFESLPRFYVTANLYRPAAPGKYPGILLPLGHWEQGKPAVQRIAANLALKGFVVLAYDPIGQGERLVAYDRRLGRSLAGGATEQHFMAGAQSLLAGESFARYRIWDGMRALDYLVSRPEVDPERIGCTGCSGGGTLTTYISALDPRVKVAAPACYMTSFRVLFSGPVGDSEQSLPNFLSSGLDQTDYIQLFAPKPWLIASTIEDFFPLEGARQIYEEARRWYRIYGAEDRIGWVVGPGPHGTPLEVREAIYEWLIRWLKNGEADFREQPVETLPDHLLFASKSGQVSEEGSREIHEIILERFQNRRTAGELNVKELLDYLRSLMNPVRETPLEVKTGEILPSADYTTQAVTFETEPGLEITGTLLVPRTAGRKPAVLSVETGAGPSPLARRLAARGAVVLALTPRGLPRPDDRGRLSGDWLMNTRAWLIGRNLPGMRAYDIRRGVEFLAARLDVDPVAIRGVARGEAGVWLLMAAALDQRLVRIWLDRTPHSLRAALEQPLHRNLHAAVMPGFCLRWDLADLVKAIEPRQVIWTDPTDWMGRVVPAGDRFRYRGFEEPDEPLLAALLQ